MLIFQNYTQHSRYQTTISVFFMSCVFLNALHLDAIYGNLQDMFLNISDVHNEFFPILHTAQYDNGTHVTDHCLTSKYTTNSCGKFKSNHHYCTYQYLNMEEKPEGEVEPTFYYDTITYDDLVQTQYSLLPYPPITKEQLEREKMYYSGI